MLALCRHRECVGSSGHPSRLTHRALASKPPISTEWKLGTLNGLVGVVVVGANARTYAQRMDRWMRRTKRRRDDETTRLRGRAPYYNSNDNGTYKYIPKGILYL